VEGRIFAGLGSQIAANGIFDIANRTVEGIRFAAKRKLHTFRQIPRPVTPDERLDDIISYRHAS